MSIIFLLYLQLFVINAEKKSKRHGDTVVSDTKESDEPGGVVVLRRCVSSSNHVGDEDHRSHGSARSGILKDENGERANHNICIFFSPIGLLSVV